VIGHDAGNLVFALSAAVDAVVLCAAVAGAVRGKEPDPGRLLAALAVAAVLLAAKGIVLLQLGVSVPFGVLHVLWLDLVVAIPLAAILLLVLTRRRAGRLLRAGAAAAVLLAPVGAYASFVEPERLVLERAELELDPRRAGDRPLRIGVIADLQCEEVGGHEREAVERLMAERPDLILLAGDYHQGADGKLDEELPALRSLLRRLDAPGGVFAVQGDVESVAEARRVTAGTGVRLLLNDVERVRVGDRRVAIAGTELAHGSPDARRTLAQLERRPGQGDVRIALAHRPDTVEHLAPNTRVDLLVAGHTHGGQVQLPVIGPLTIASKVPREVGAGGLHELDGRRIYVSRGVGAERGQAPRLRLGAVPEVSLITLR
jgi:predicted MPP superfamily phosphohydrolase